jgi:hypothetical protein
MTRATYRVRPYTIRPDLRPEPEPAASARPEQVDAELLRQAIASRGGAS